MGKRKEPIIKRYLLKLLCIVFVVSMAACGNLPNESTEPVEPTISVTAIPVSSEPDDHADFGSENPSESSDSAPPAEYEEGVTPEIADGTPVTLTIGDTVIPAKLNDTVTAKAFIEQLPFTVSASKMQYDFCGTVEPLPYEDAERQAGWKNGDIGYSNGWFALFHSGEEESSGYTTEMIIGHIDDEYLETVRSMSGSIPITVSLAE